jgi:CRISPR-associated protein Cas2
MSSPETFLCIICYDIPHDRRRTRLARVLEAYGDRLQESVFEALLDPPRIQRMQGEIEAEIDPLEDRVTLLILCAGCRNRRIGLGLDAQRTPIGEEDAFIV